MLWLAVCWCMLTGALSGRILAVLPFPGKSHFIFSSAVLRTLALHGHQVVHYSPFPATHPGDNYTHVEVHTAFEDKVNSWKYEDFARHRSIEDQPTIGVGIEGVWNMTYSICEQTFEHEKIKKLLNSKEHFDLVLTESTFGQESMLAFGHRFQAPTITLQAFLLWNVLNRVAGNSLSMASVPDFYSTAMTDHMSFLERVVNSLSSLMTLYQFYNVHLPAHQRIVDKHFPGEAPSVEAMVTDVSLYFTNSLPAVGYSQPYTPNIIPVAGITLTPDRTSLPQDLTKFMDSAKDGVIYFSIGTVLPLHIFPMKILQIFVNVFKKVNQKVIWKIELEDIPGLSSNVMLRKWLPQPAVLAHPSLVLFLTHGGLNSQLEAIHAGVPTVGIPFFGDQKYNVRFNQHHGIGEEVVFKTLSEESLLSGITKVLQDSRYSRNARRMSSVFRDRPVSSVDSLVYWTEYVLRHGGAHHLRSSAATLPWFQLWLIDIAAVITFVVVTLVVVTRTLLYVVCGKKSASDY